MECKLILPRKEMENCKVWRNIYCRIKEKKQVNKSSNCVLRYPTKNLALICRKRNHRKIIFLPIFLTYYQNEKFPLQYVRKSIKIFDDPIFCTKWSCMTIFLSFSGIFWIFSIFNLNSNGNLIFPEQIILLDGMYEISN